MASNHSNSCLIYFLFQLALSIILAAFTSIHVSSAPSGETSSESFVSSPESEISSSEQDTEVKMITKRAAPGYGPSWSGYGAPSNGYGYGNSYGKSDSDEEYDPDDYNPDDDMGYQGGSGDGNENDYYEYKGYK